MRFVGKVYGPRARVVFAVYGIYALLRTDAVPGSWSARLPVIRSLFSFGPWWGWVIAGLCLLTLATLTGTYRIVQSVDLDIDAKELLPVGVLVPAVSDPLSATIEGVALRLRIFNHGTAGTFRTQISYLADKQLLNSPRPGLRVGQTLRERISSSVAAAVTPT